MTDAPETILTRVDEIYMRRSSHNHVLGVVELNAGDFRFLIDQLRAAVTKTVLCGNCGRRYQSPMQDPEHGHRKCASSEGR